MKFDVNWQEHLNWLKDAAGDWLGSPANWEHALTAVGALIVLGSALTVVNAAWNVGKAGWALTRLGGLGAFRGGSLLARLGWGLTKLTAAGASWPVRRLLAPSPLGAAILERMKGPFRYGPEKNSGWFTLLWDGLEVRACHAEKRTPFVSVAGGNVDQMLTRTDMRRIRKAALAADAPHRKACRLAADFETRAEKERLAAVLRLAPQRPGAYPTEAACLEAIRRGVEAKSGGSPKAEGSVKKEPEQAKSDGGFASLQDFIRATKWDAVPSSTGGAVWQAQLNEHHKQSVQPTEYVCFGGGGAGGGGAGGGEYTVTAGVVESAPEAVPLTTGGAFYPKSDRCAINGCAVCSGRVRTFSMEDWSVHARSRAELLDKSKSHG